MNLSLDKSGLVDYIADQLQNFYPDKKKVNLGIQQSIDFAIQRLEFCFKYVSNKRYNLEGSTFYNHLYSDHNILFLWFLSNTVWLNYEDKSLADKIYYLNKTLHGFDCLYDTKMPDIFLVFHGVGTMLGKATYNNFFVVTQGCTVGAHHGNYPVFGKGVSLTANSSVIGKCMIGDRVNVGTRTLVYECDIDQDHTIFTDLTSGKLQAKKSKEAFAQQFFNVDLKHSNNI